MKSGHGSPCGFWSLKGHGAFPSALGQCSATWRELCGSTQDSAAPCPQAAQLECRTCQPHTRSTELAAQSCKGHAKYQRSWEWRITCCLKDIWVFFFLLKNHHDNKQNRNKQKQQNANPQPSEQGINMKK